MLAGVGIDTIDPLALVEDLSLAQRQTVEIVRALSHDPDILFLDEPTSSLVEHEVYGCSSRSVNCAGVVAA